MARMEFTTFIAETKRCMTFGGYALFQISPTSNELRALNSRMHMQYLAVVDNFLMVPSAKTREELIYTVNKFLTDSIDINTSKYGTSRFFKNFRDYIFKPVYHAHYTAAVSAMPEGFLTGPFNKELFSFWLFFEH